MATCSSSTLQFSSPWPHRFTRSNSPSFLSIHLSNRFLIPRTNTGIGFSRYNAVSVSSSISDNAESSDTSAHHKTKSSTWKWRGYSIRYQYSGSTGPALVLIHGFGANSDHWRKNLPVLARTHRVYAIDLIGYGYSDKPNPHKLQKPNPGTIVNTQILSEVSQCAEGINGVKESRWKSTLSFYRAMVRGIVGLQAAVMNPATSKGIILLNISLRMLHIKKQPWYARPLIKSFQSLLRNTSLGKLFFKTVATPESVRNILCQVTDELVKIILDPGLDPGAADVFLEFICYSWGPLPEDLLPQVKCPVLVAWGDKDPWEPIDMGKAYALFDSVEDFVVLPNVGHCPQDEAPQLVNPLVASFVARHGSSPAYLPSAVS